MTLKKLPCEYKELSIKRTKECFGDLTKKQKQHLIKCFTQCANNLEKIKYEKKS